MSDLRDYQEGIKELYETLGTSEVLFYPLDTTQVEENIYNEFVGSQEYSDPIPLSCMVNFENATDMLNEGNSLLIPQVTITVAYLTLEENDLLDKTILEQGKIVFEDLEYQVYEVLPKGFFLGKFSSYVLYCRGGGVI